MNLTRVDVKLKCFLCVFFIVIFKNTAGESIYLTKLCKTMWARQVFTSFVFVEIILFLD